MLTNFSLWGIYTASYVVDYAALLLISLLQKIDTYRKANLKVGFLTYCGWQDYLIWVVLIALIVFSIVCAERLKKIPMNTRIKEYPKDNIVWEIAGYVLAQVLTILTVIFSDYWIIISGVIFLIAGVIFVNSKKVHYSPLFIIPMGYRVFQCDGAVVVTNYSKDGLKLALEMDVDGVQARELEDGIYLVRKKK